MLFSESWAVIPTVEDMVEFSIRYLKSNGKIVILTTLEDDNCTIRKFAKPKIKYILGKKNDFGRCTSLTEMKNFLKKFQKH